MSLQIDWVSTRGSRLRKLSRAARSTTISGSADASPLDHADAGRVESELRARGVTVLDTTYGASATLRLGVVPDQEERLAALVAELTAGAGKTTVAGERWVDSLAP